MRPLALYRLAGLTPVMFFPMSLVAILLLDLPFLGLDPPARAILNGDGTAEVRAALWHLVMYWPAVIGAVVCTLALELRHTTMSWILPGVRGDLLAGTLLAAIPLALVLALLVAHNAPAETAMAAFALALFWFALPGLILDLVTPMLARLLGVAVFGWTLYAQPAYVQLIEAHPVLTGPVALALAVGMFWLVQTPHAARRRVIGYGQIREAGGHRWLIRALGIDARKEWSNSLATERILPWLRAAAHEAAVPFLIANALLAIATVLYARWLDQPHLVVLGAAIFLPGTHLQLRKEVLYPLSRARRADLAHAGAIVSAIAFSAATAVALAVSAQFPELLSDARRSPLSWYLAPVVVVLFAPIVQWGTIRSPRMAGSTSWNKMLWGGFRWFFLFFLLAGGSIHLLADPHRSTLSTEVLLATIAILGAATHVIHWLTLPRFFASADLGERWSPR